MTRLFVYGTLRREIENRWSRHLASRGRHGGEGWVAGKLYRVTWYPAAVPDETGRIVGDVYELPDPAEEILASLDAYESDAYERAIVPVPLADGRVVDGWIYWYVASTDRLVPIPSGDFLSAP